MDVNPTKRISLWYHGGIASAAAACCTHPLDLLKVNKHRMLVKINWSA